MKETTRTSNFPIFKTKLEESGKTFDLTNPKDQQEYFQLKAGKEIRKLKEFLKENTFVAYLVGKKNSGKGTYSKMFGQIVDPDAIDHFSIGDMTRETDIVLKDPKQRSELISFLKSNYRGWSSLEDILAVLENRNTKTLLPTELILALVKREMAKREKKTIFIDGFPRNLDQVSYSLFFRDLIGYRDDPDVFIFIQVPEKVIDERLKWRRVCPLCKTSRNLRLFPTSEVIYDKEKKEFYLWCDNPDCKGAKMELKEGDELGISAIKERLGGDELLMKKAMALHGIPKVFLRNSIPADMARYYIDDYEITPEYILNWDAKNEKVKISEKSWTIQDDEGIPSYSLLAQPVVVSLIKQLVQIFNLL